jgi:hypothetical protein
MLTVMPLDFLYSGGNINYDVCGPFCHFSSLTALMKGFSWFYDKYSCPHTHSVPMIFLQLWRVLGGGVVVFKVV